MTRVRPQDRGMGKEPQSSRGHRPAGQAASSIAHGDLSARLVPRGDPDLDDLAAAFNRMAEELEQRVQADARFASDVSRELRTPLTTMLNSPGAAGEPAHDAS